MQTTREILEHGIGVGCPMVIYGKGMLPYKVRKVAKKRQGKHLYSILRINRKPGESGGYVNCTLEQVMMTLAGEM